MLCFIYYSSVFRVDNSTMNIDQINFNVGTALFTDVARALRMRHLTWELQVRDYTLQVMMAGSARVKAHLTLHCVCTVQ